MRGDREFSGKYTPDGVTVWDRRLLGDACVTQILATVAESGEYLGDFWTIYRGYQGAAA